MKKYCVALLALLPLTALAYPIDLDKRIDDGIKIDVQSYDTAYDIGAASLTNYGTTAALCKVRFRNGPEAPRVRRVNVPAGKSVDVTAKFNRQIIKLRIALNCSAE